ncbi:hypothetical protein [Cupriavidus lacunae]|uniref:hypothetical protein n=1 Tax=Cupriavidus lacunae TaxID=2666307 RepID=UPI001FC93562|nr:hypothetical protein [Cupriavidus lacunae]
MDRPIATLRAEIAGATPAMRAARAQQMFGDLAERDLVLPLVQVSGTVDGAPMIAFRLGDQLLFALTAQDLSPEDSLTLEAAAALSLLGLAVLAALT